MARKGRLPKAIIRKYGISKKAWSVYRGKRRKRPVRSRARRRVVRRRSRRVSSNPGRKGPGMMGKLNKVLRGLKLGLPAINSFTSGLAPGDAAKDALMRYSGFDIDEKKLNTENVKKAAAFYGGNLIEQKVMGFLRIPQMAGRKKILSVFGQYLPEVQAATDLAGGMALKSVGNRYGQRSIGYRMDSHETWLETPWIRDQWLGTLGARVGLGLVSKFVGPMVNKYLPKGVNI